VVAVPRDYVSGAPLGTSTATFANATFMSLGLTPGAYVWRWGSGPTADTFTPCCSWALPGWPLREYAALSLPREVMVPRISRLKQ
jgi:hypothetical protein